MMYGRGRSGQVQLCVLFRGEREAKQVEQIKQASKQVSKLCLCLCVPCVCGGSGRWKVVGGYWVWVGG